MVTQTKIGRYEVLATLGQGAMGTVYQAVDPLIERTVAIKTINLDLSAVERAEFEERFYREAKSAGRLNHANIVTIYDVGEAGDIAYIAMEYLEGESLREMLDSGVVLPVEMISKIVARIASALSYAHENKVVHRDIKPANIMVMANRDVKIMDFGIAQIPTGSRTQLGTVLGSPKYMAPEQVDGLPSDGRADIFALGVVLYEMLTGVTPFNGDNLSAIMYKILNETPVSPSMLNARVPPALDRVVSRALAKRPEDRYQTAREFARDLGEPDADSTPLAHPTEKRNKPLDTGPKNKSAHGQQDATIFLPPNQARGLGAPAVSEAGFMAKVTNALGDAPLGRKALIAGIPLLALAVFVAYPPALQHETAVPQQSAPVDDARMAPPVAVVAVPDENLVPHVDPVAEVKRGGAVVNSDPVPPTSTKGGGVAATATVSFAVSPWGEIFVDGKSAGVAPPLTNLPLDSGTYRVEIRNPGFESYRGTVQLKPGQTLKIRHKFR